VKTEVLNLSQQSEIRSNLTLHALAYKLILKELYMRKHEINKRKKTKQKRRESSKSQVSKKHKRKHKDKQAHRK